MEAAEQEMMQEDGTADAGMRDGSSADEVIQEDAAAVEGMREGSPVEEGRQEEVAAEEAVLIGAAAEAGVQAGSALQNEGRGLIANQPGWAARWQQVNTEREEQQETAERVGELTAATGKLEYLFDGGSRLNPGIAGAGALIRWSDATGPRDTLWEGRRFVGMQATNNEAEYEGLLLGLQAAARLFPGCQLEVFGDSQLVLRQMSDEGFPGP